MYILICVQCIIFFLVYQYSQLPSYDFTWFPKKREVINSCVNLVGFVTIDRFVIKRELYAPRIHDR